MAKISKKDIEVRAGIDVQGPKANIAIGPQRPIKGSATMFKPAEVMMKGSASKTVKPADIEASKKRR